MVKKSKGRQKVEMVKMEKQSNLQVTFSKRRSGLFKKASELCTLCGAEVGIVVFSPGHKVFSFGHPNVEAIIDRFIGNPHQDSDSMQILDAHRNVNVGQLSVQLMQLMREIEVEKNKSERLNMITKARQDAIWWEKPVEKLNYNELAQLKDALEGLKKNVMNEAERVMMMQCSNHDQTIYAASASSRQVPVKGEMIPYNHNIMPPTTFHPYHHGYGHGGFY